MGDRSLLAPWGGFRPVAGVPVSSQVSVTISGIPLPECRVVIHGTGGMSTGATARLQFNGDAGTNYLSASAYVQGSSAVSGNAPGTSGRDVSGQLAITASASAVPYIHIDSYIWTARDGGIVMYEGRFVSKGASDAVFIEGIHGGAWDQTAADVQSITFLFGQAFTGTIRVYG